MITTSTENAKRPMRAAARAILLLPLLALPCLRAGTDETADVVQVRIHPDSDRQTIDGFGGSIAYWGYDADETALRYAFDDLGATFVRVPGDVTQSGEAEQYRAALARVARVAPRAKVLVSFWQPRTADKPDPADWLDAHPAGGLALRPALYGAWADAVVARVKRMRDEWKVNVVAVSPQNEPNFSTPAWPTCRWDPPALADFIAKELAPRLAKAKLPVEIATPEVAYVGGDASEAKKYRPATAAGGIVCYHMYDSYKHGEADGGFTTLRGRQAALGHHVRETLPGRRLWMTETTGAQWNSKDWHTLGWRPEMDEHAQAIAAGRYVHAALVDAGANAFLWWGLVYSAPPASVKAPRERQKFRDEGLILVDPEKKAGAHAFKERTRKYFVLKQFARFVRPGWVRVAVTAEPTRLVAAFRSPDRKTAAVVIVHSDGIPRTADVRVTGDAVYRLSAAYRTDRTRECAPVEWDGTLPAESVTTLLYNAP
jgi:glucuronoarabinoxylan endo-1,4-beta-xylanase